jgi:hypothetical protein
LVASGSRRVPAWVHHRGTEGWRCSSAIQNTSHAVPDELHVEIEEEADAEACEPEVCEQLRAVYLVEALDGFYFNHDSILDAQVEPDPGFQVQALVEHGDEDLSMNL